MGEEVSISSDQSLELLSYDAAGSLPKNGPGQWIFGKTSSEKINVLSPSM
jgi:hypothetical protein